MSVSSVSEHVYGLGNVTYQRRDDDRHSDGEDEQRHGELVEEGQSGEHVGRGHLALLQEEVQAEGHQGYEHRGGVGQKSYKNEHFEFFEQFANITYFFVFVA